MEREFETGPLVAAAGAALLIVSLFLDWFDDFSGWTTFETLDLVLAALALGAIAVAAADLGAPPVVGERALMPLGGIALVIVGSQLANHPPLGIERDLETGAWLALVGAAVMLGGALVTGARVSVAVQRRDRPAGAAPAPVPAPAPAPAPAERPHAEPAPTTADEPVAMPESETAGAVPHGDPLGDDATTPLGEERTQRLEEEGA